MDRKIGVGIAFGVALGIAAPAVAQQAVQWRVEDGGNGHWYQLRSSGSPRGTAGNWDFLRSLAESVGASLCSIDSIAENEVVKDLVTTANPFEGFWSYLGATQFMDLPCGGHNWAWIDDSAWDFTNWQPGQPDCVIAKGRFEEPRMAMRAITGQWGDWTDRALNTAVIEWSADCNGDGIVDYGQCRDGSLPDYDGDNIPDCCEAGTSCTVGNYPVQWRVEEGGNGHWYGYTKSMQAESWSEGLARCAAAGGHLVTLANAAEDDFVLTRMLAGRIGQFEFGPFIGGYKDVTVSAPESVCAGWHWITGEPFAYIQIAALCGTWATYYPFEDRLHYWIGEQLIWNNTVVDTPVHHRLIEWSADCDADGVVDYGQILLGQVADVNGNGIPDTCDCPADINQSGTIDAEDLAYVLFAWGMTGGKAGDADINGDATVDANDLSLVLGSWGPCPG